MDAKTLANHYVELMHYGEKAQAESVKEEYVGGLVSRGIKRSHAERNWEQLVTKAARELMHEHADGMFGGKKRRKRHSKTNSRRRRKTHKSKKRKHKGRKTRSRTRRNRRR